MTRRKSVTGKASKVSWNEPPDGLWLPSSVSLFETQLFLDPAHLDGPLTREDVPPKHGSEWDAGLIDPWDYEEWNDDELDEDETE